MRELRKHARLSHKPPRVALRCGKSNDCLSRGSNQSGEAVDDHETALQSLAQVARNAPLEIFQGHPFVRQPHAKAKARYTRAWPRRASHARRCSAYTTRPPRRAVGRSCCSSNTQAGGGSGCVSELSGSERAVWQLMIGGWAPWFVDQRDVAGAARRRRSLAGRGVVRGASSSLVSSSVSHSRCWSRVQPSSAVRRWYSSGLASAQ